MYGVWVITQLNCEKKNLNWYEYVGIKKKVGAGVVRGFKPEWDDRGGINRDLPRIELVG